MIARFQSISRTPITAASAEAIGITVSAAVKQHK